MEPINLKPDFFYEDYIGDLDTIKWAKEKDKNIKYFKIITKRNDLEVETYGYDDKGNQIVYEEGDKPKFIFCRFKTPSDIPQFAMDWYEAARRSDSFFNFYIQCNNLEENRKYLERCSQVLDLFEDKRDISVYKEDVKKLYEILNRGYLITFQLRNLIDNIVETLYDKIGLLDDEYCIYKNGEGEETDSLVLYPDGTSRREIVKIGIFDINKLKNRLDEENQKEIKVLELIREQAQWRNIERDIEIYEERQKGETLENLSEHFGIDNSTVSVIVKKVHIAITNTKNYLFKLSYFQKLRNKRRFDRVDWYNEKEKSIIIAFDLENNTVFLYFFRFKISNKSLKILKNDLKTFYTLAYNYQFEYEKTNLILVVFNNANKSIEEINLNFNNPKDISI